MQQFKCRFKPFQVILVSIPILALALTAVSIPCHADQYSATLLGSTFASLTWGMDGLVPVYYCLASAGINNTSFTTDYHGNIEFKVTYTADHDKINDTAAGDYDARFRWYVDDVLQESKSIHCTYDCLRTGTILHTMHSPGGTTQYSVRLEADNWNYTKSCDNSQTKTLDIIRPICDTSLYVDPIGIQDQSVTVVPISGRVQDLTTYGCGANVNDPTSVRIKVTGPDGDPVDSSAPDVDVVNGYFSWEAELINVDKASSYGEYNIEVKYTPNSPDHPLNESSDTESFDRLYKVDVPSPPAGVCKMQPVLGGARFAVGDFTTGEIYFYGPLELNPESAISAGPYLGSSIVGLEDVPNFLLRDDEPLLAIAQMNSYELLFMNLEGYPVLTYPSPVGTPWGLAYDPSRQSLWIASTSDSRVYQMRLEDGYPLGFLELPGWFLMGLEYDDIDGWLYASAVEMSSGDGWVIRIDLNSGDVFPLTPLGPDWCSITLHEDGIYVGNLSTNEFTLLGQTTGSPGIPSLVEASSGPETPNAIEVAWQDPDQGPPWTRVRIYRDGALLDTVDPGVEVYRDSGLGEHSYHEYYVTAYRNEGENGESSPSDTVGTYAGTRPPITIHVPADHPSIQSAVQAAMDEDTILVEPGTYAGPIDFWGRDVCIMSAAGPSETIIDGGGLTFSLVVCDSTEGANAVLSGFTLTGCNLHHGRGVVKCGPDASPMIEYNIITGNTVWFSGAGIMCEGGGVGTPIIANNTIVHNSMRPDTLGVFVGGGIYCSDASPIITRNIIGFSDSGGYGIYCDGAGAAPLLSCNDLWENPHGSYHGCVSGDDDFEEDPLFCDSVGADFSLCADSPCIDGYECGLIGALGEGCGECGVSTHYADHDVGNCTLTVTDQGILGFMDNSQAHGTGFVYPTGGDNHLYLGSLWVGESEAYVANRDYGPEPIKEWIVSSDPDGRIWEEDPGDSDQDIHAYYTDSGAAEPRGLFVHQESWAYADPTAAREFIIINYTIRNDSATALESLLVGCFLDTDIGDLYNDDVGGTDQERRLAYATDASGIHVGVRLLHDESGQEPTVGNLTLISNSMCGDVYIHDDTKYRLLSAAGPEYTLPETTVPADYRILASAGPINLGAGEDTLLAFAILGGESLHDLQGTADVAQVVFARGTANAPESVGIRGVTRLLRPSPNPFCQDTQIRFELARPSSVNLAVYDVNGRLVRTLEEGQHAAAVHTRSWNGRDNDGRRVPGGIFFVRLEAGGKCESRPLVYLK